MVQDPYAVLGVSRDAGEEEIKSAYRRLAKKYHPDLHPGDAAAARKMNEINAAYEQIKNPPRAGASDPYARRSTQTRQSYEDFRQEEWHSPWQENSRGSGRPRSPLFFVFLVIIVINLLTMLFSSGRSSQYSGYGYGTSPYTQQEQGLYPGGTGDSQNSDSSQDDSSDTQTPFFGYGQTDGYGTYGGQNAGTTE